MNFGLCDGKMVGLKTVIKADTTSLPAFDFGLFTWMELTQLVLLYLKLEPNEFAY
jgi:hypothetical protein